MTCGLASALRVDSSAAAGGASEDDGVDGTEPGGGEHGDGRLGDHGHVDDDAVAFGDTKRG